MKILYVEDNEDNIYMLQRRLVRAGYAVVIARDGAEGVAMGTARGGLPPDAPLHLAAIVSVQIKPAGQFRIIAPCGVCRELISDYSPDARVWLTGDSGIVSMAALDLLPHKTRRLW